MCVPKFGLCVVNALKRLSICTASSDTSMLLYMISEQSPPNWLKCFLEIAEFHSVFHKFTLMISLLFSFLKSTFINIKITLISTQKDSKEI